MTKHVEQNHASLLKRFREELGSHSQPPSNHEPPTKWQQVAPSSILQFYSSPHPFLKYHEIQKRFLEDVMLFVIKSFLPLRIVEPIWFQRLALQLCPKVSFLSRKVFTKKVLPSLVNTTSIEFVQPTLVECLIATCTFHLWMSKGAHDVFAMVVNFLSISSKPKHITIGLFEANNTNGVAMAMKLKQILKKFGLTEKIMAYVKDEGSNLATCAQALKVVVSCVDLDKAKPHLSMDFL